MPLKRSKLVDSGDMTASPHFNNEIIEYLNKELIAEMRLYTIDLLSVVQRGLLQSTKVILKEKLSSSASLHRACITFIQSYGVQCEEIEQ